MYEYFFLFCFLRFFCLLQKLVSRRVRVISKCVGQMYSLLIPFCASSGFSNPGLFSSCQRIDRQLVLKCVPWNLKLQRKISQLKMEIKRDLKKEKTHNPIYLISGCHLSNAQKSTSHPNLVPRTYRKTNVSGCTPCSIEPI